jgi:Na+/H+-dicarboxylate symporter/ABC-type amino acid transport substrate-binding protein
LNHWAIYALVLGIGTGFLLGPSVIPWLSPLADAFSMLLQMAVFPYVYLSLILGIGLILPKDALRLLKYGLLSIGAMWALVYFFLYFLSQTIPAPLPSLIAVKTNIDQQNAFQSMFESLIPESGLDALGNNIIIAGFTFSLFFGALLMYTEKKEYLVPYLERSLQLLEKIFQWLRLIAPIGAFLYIAIACASIRWTDLEHIEFYFFSRMAFPIFFVILVIPLIVSNFTTISIKDVLKLFQEICLLPFLVGSSVLVVPFLICRRQMHTEDYMILPAAYSLGQIGIAINLFVLSYLSFYYRLYFSLIEKISIYFRLSSISVQDSFTSLNTGFLIDQFHFPPTGVKLYAESALILHHFLVLLSVASIVAITLLMQSAFRGELRIQTRKLVGSFTALSLFFIGVIYGTKWLIHPPSKVGQSPNLDPMTPISSFRTRVHLVDYYQGLYQQLKISDAIEYPVQATLVLPGEKGTFRDPNESTFAQILKTGVLKIGVDPFAIPYSYWNDSHELVGYDIAYAHQLARDLDCSLELILVDLDRIGEQLSSGDYDLGMAAFLMTEQRIQLMAFSNPYREEENVLIVPRSKQDEFMNLKDLQQRTTLTIVADGAYASVAKRHFPQARIVSDTTTVLSENGQADARFWARTSGRIWCLAHPEFVTIDYGAPLGSCYLGYPVRENAMTFAAFLNNWLKVKEQTGFYQAMVQYWIREPGRNLTWPRKI